MGHRLLPAVVLAAAMAVSVGAPAAAASVTAPAPTFADRQSPPPGQDTVLTYGATLTVRGREYYIDTRNRHVPLGGGRLEIKAKYDDSPEIDGTEPVVATTTTKADGTYAVTLHPDRHAFRYYVELAAGTTPGGVAYTDGITWTGRVDVKVSVWLRSRPARLPARTIGSVEGATVPLTGRPVFLQRWTGGAFTIVSTATVRSSGRFTLAVQPPRGTWRYRVYVPGDGVRFAGVTPEFLVTGS